MARVDHMGPAIVVGRCKQARARAPALSSGAATERVRVLLEERLRPFPLIQPRPDLGTQWMLDQAHQRAQAQRFGAVKAARPAGDCEGGAA